MASKWASKCKCSMPKPKKDSDSLKGWQQIAAFLGQPVSVAQRWANSGMPVEKRGRYVYSAREELSRWLGRESAGGRSRSRLSISTSVRNSSGVCHTSASRAEVKARKSESPNEEPFDSKSAHSRRLADLSVPIKRFRGHRFDPRS